MRQGVVHRLRADTATNARFCPRVAERLWRRERAQCAAVCDGGCGGRSRFDPVAPRAVPWTGRRARAVHDREVVPGSRAGCRRPPPHVDDRCVDVRWWPAGTPASLPPGRPHRSPTPGQTLWPDHGSEPIDEQAHLPAEQPSAGQDPRFPPPDAHPRRTLHPLGAPSQGPLRAVGLSSRSPRPCSRAPRGCAAARTSPRPSDAARAQVAPCSSSISIAAPAPTPPPRHPAPGPTRGRDSS